MENRRCSFFLRTWAYLSWLLVVLAKAAPSATYTLRNMLGQTVATSLFTKVSTTGLTAGMYLLAVQPAGEAAVTRRVTQETTF